MLDTIIGDLKEKNIFSNLWNKTLSSILLSESLKYCCFAGMHLKHIHPSESTKVSKIK